MAALYAELQLEGRVYPLRLCRLDFHQDTDARGRVIGKVRPGLLFLTADVPEDPSLEAWAAASHKPLAGRVVFYDLARQVPHETIAFAAGHCVYYGEDFFSGSVDAGAYVCHLRIAAPAFELLTGGPAATLATAGAGWVGPVAAVPTSGLISTPLPATAPEYTLAEFARTIWGADQVAATVITQLFAHFTDAASSAYPAPHWAAMEELIRTTTYTDAKDEIAVLNGGWPPANGGVNKRLVFPAPPDKFDRYQKKVDVDEEGLPVIGGKFTSPLPKNGAFDYEARALEGREEEYDLVYEIEVLKPLPFLGEEADIIPWHGHTGNGVQTLMKFPPYDPVTGSFPWDWKKLKDKGYIRIKFRSSPSGKFIISPDGTTAKVKTV